MKKIILAIIVALPIVAYADRVTMKSQTAFTFNQSGIGESALSKNKERKALIISNNGADAIFVMFGASTASAFVGMQIPANTAFEFKNVPMDEVLIRGPSTPTGTRSVVLSEFE